MTDFLSPTTLSYSPPLHGAAVLLHLPGTWCRAGGTQGCRDMTQPGTRDMTQPGTRDMTQPGT